MDISLESEADALWQDAMDLLAGRGLPEAVLAMLKNCAPCRIQDATLYLETPMRLVQKTVSKNTSVVEECLSAAAFEPMHFEITFVPSLSVPLSPPSSSMSREEARRWAAETEQPKPTASTKCPQGTSALTWEETPGDEMTPRRHKKNPLVEDIPEATSKLTFARFVCGEENELAYQASLQVANGVNSTYNPLFIYGKSGLGKTHLLRAIQNYIAQSDPSRLCAYRDASSFITDYTEAMRHNERSAASVLRQNYEDIDVLIIDDIQKMAGKAGTVGFFFDTFNALISNGKQIVLAADRTPAELGMGKDGFDERITSRLSSGFITPVQVPSYELKLRLIETFCHQMREDARRENVQGLDGIVPDEVRGYMAERAGANIRVIEGFCQRCLYAATAAEAHGRTLGREEVDALAKECWPSNRRSFSIEDVQKAVEAYYDIDHASLVSGKRKKEIVVPRHVAIWLSRELCDRTLADIGDHFGGRSHATVKHSIKVVEDAKKEDRSFYDQVMQLKEAIIGNS